MCNATGLDKIGPKNDDEDIVLPQPYTTLLFHPHVSWMELIFNWLGRKVLPLEKMCNFVPNNSTETIATVREIDTKMKSFHYRPLRSSIE